MENNLQTKSEEIDPNERFGTALAGKKVDTIRMAMPHYDQMQTLVRLTLSKEIDKLPNEKISVLEIGTGTGFTAKEIISADKRINLISIDNEAKMIKEAKENLHEYCNSGKLKLIKADALSFLSKMPADSVDFLASGFVLHNFEKIYRERVILEIYRVLKIDGLFINADKLLPDNKDELSREYQWQLDMFNKADVDEATRKAWLDHYKFDNRPDIAIKESGMIKILRTAGFQEIEISNRNHLEALLTARK